MNTTVSLRLTVSMTYFICYFYYFIVICVNNVSAEITPTHVHDVTIANIHNHRHHHHYRGRDLHKRRDNLRKVNLLGRNEREAHTHHTHQTHRTHHTSHRSVSQLNWHPKLSPSSIVSLPMSFSRTRTASKVTRKGNNHSAAATKQPNIIFILTDDQDIELGSMNFMPKTLRILGDGGAHFPNAYVTTPMCCPSRSSILTGLYVHNHNVYTNNDNCSSQHWQNTHEKRTFAAFLNNAGYRTAYFGKYLNEYNGTYIPYGWREWSALVRNSRFYNYTLNVNGQKVKHGDNYEVDYYPDLIVNDSLQFLRYSKRFFANKPLMMVLSFPSPHGPEDAAPQFHHLFHNVTTHRTPSWNYAPNIDKQWLLRHTGKMERLHSEFTDTLHTKRLQTLQSVDSAVERIYDELLMIGELDHGYHLGQFGLVKGKSMPFEFDVRVPFYVRGPKVPPGAKINDIVLNIDFAPTFLDIAGVDVPEHMDGKSIVPLLYDAYNRRKNNNNNNNDHVPRKRQWRDTFLIERGKSMREYNDGVTPVEKSLTKRQWLSIECQKPEYRSPCGPFQKWECVYDGHEMRIRKCRKTYIDAINRHFRKRKCLCPPPEHISDDSFDGDNFGDNLNANDDGDDFLDTQLSPEMIIKKKRAKLLDPFERKLQRRFLKEHVINKHFRPVFIGSRPKRGIITDDFLIDEFDVEGVYQLSKILDVRGSNDSDLLYGNANALHRFRNNSDAADGADDCVILSNHSVSCSLEVYQNRHVWREKKERLDLMIKKLQVKLEELRGIRRHLNIKRPLLQGHDRSTSTCECSPKGDYQKNHHFKHRYTSIRNRKRYRTTDKLRRKEKKLRRKTKFENTTCNYEKMNCFTHDNDHWKTPPFWTKGPFCFCQNSNNNTFWCLRTINDTHNFLYCEFVTGYITYYNLLQDPYQLRNAVYDLEFNTLEELRRQLNRMKNCAGAKECTLQHKPTPNNNNNDALSNVKGLSGKRTDGKLRA